LVGMGGEWAFGRADKASTSARTRRQFPGFTGLMPAMHFTLQSRSPLSRFRTGPSWELALDFRQASTKGAGLQAQCLRACKLNLPGHLAEGPQWECRDSGFQGVTNTNLSEENSFSMAL
jgi:hypothetical protein